MYLVVVRAAAKLPNWSVDIDLKYHKKQKIFSEKQKGFRDGLSTPPLKKVKKQGEMPLPSLGPIPSLNSTFF